MRLNEAEVTAAVGTVSVTELRLWVREGWIVPQQGEAGLVFDDMDVARIRLVCQLRDDLNIGEDAVPVVLSLMDQLYGLRREMKALAQAVDRQPDTVRREIRAAYRALTSRS